MTKYISSLDTRSFFQQVISCEGINASSLWSSTVWAAYKLHRVWLHVRFGLDYAAPENHPYLIAGHITHFMFGDKSFYQQAAKTLLISRLFMEVLCKARDCSRAFHRWQQSCLLEELLSENVMPVRSSCFSVFLEKEGKKHFGRMGKTQTISGRFFVFVK